MPFPKSPISRILTRMKDIAEAAELHVAFGMEVPFKYRHERHRRTTRSERPGVAFRLVNIAVDGDAGQDQSEIAWKAEIDIVIDLELPSEDVENGGDETGWDMLSATGNAVANLFLPNESPLRLLVDDILPGDVDPDEDSKPDDARLAQSLVVLYRTPWDDLNTLLSSEENAL